MFEIVKPEDTVPVAPPSSDVTNDSAQSADPNAGRYVRYEFPPEFLKLRQIGAT